MWRVAQCECISNDLVRVRDMGIINIFDQISLLRCIAYGMFITADIWSRFFFMNKSLLGLIRRTLAMYFLWAVFDGDIDVIHCFYSQNSFKNAYCSLYSYYKRPHDRNTQIAEYILDPFVPHEM